METTGIECQSLCETRVVSGGALTAELLDLPNAAKVIPPLQRGSHTNSLKREAGAELRVSGQSSLM